MSEKIQEKPPEVFVSLREDIARLREDIAALTERVAALLELRTANGTLYQTQFRAFEERCDERHGELVRRVNKLESAERSTYGWRERVTGMGVPVAVLVSIVAVVLSVVR